MYLSRVEIDRNNRKNMKELSHLGAYHNWVEISFPEEFKSEVRTRKLWRIDELDGKTYLIIASKSMPNLKLLERYGVEGTAQSKSYDKFLGNIAVGKAYRFKVVLNPVVSRMFSEKNRRGVVRALPNEQQLKFLYDRSEKNGFHIEPDEAFISSRENVLWKKHNEKSVMLSKAVYEGRLTVSNRDLFISSLTEGIGKKKAYGFGMMTIIPEE